MDTIPEIDISEVLKAYDAHSLRIDADGSVFAVTVYSSYKLDDVAVKFFPAPKVE